MAAREGRPRGETDARGQQDQQDQQGRRERQEHRGPGPAPRQWGDPSSGWLFHAPGPWPAARRGPSSERFGIFRDSGRSRSRSRAAAAAAALGSAGSVKGARRHATRWAVITALVAMLTLFVCLLLVDFTRSEASLRSAENATSRSYADDEPESGAAGRASERDRAREERRQDQGSRDRGRQGREDLREDPATIAPNHRYLTYPSHRHLLLPTRDFYGRSLKGRAASGGDTEEADSESDSDLRWGERADVSLEDEQYDDDEEEADDAYSFTSPHLSSSRAYRSLHLGGGEGIEEGAPSGHGVSTTAASSTVLAAMHAKEIGDSSTPAGDGEPEPFEPPGEDLLRSLQLASLTSGPSSPAEETRTTHSAADQRLDGDVADFHEYPSELAAQEHVAERSLGSDATGATSIAEDRSDVGSGDEPQDLPDDGNEGQAVALPYHGSLDLRWPGALAEERDRERWTELVRMQQQQQQSAEARRAAHAQAQAAQQREAQRRNFFSELGTIQGEQYLMPYYPPPQDNLGPVLFPSGSKQQADAAAAAAAHLAPKKLMKLMGGSRPWSSYQAHPSQNQYLVVNNKGVVIPHSVNFPDLVKTANFPQLQNYRNQQSSKNIQDILNYLKGGKRRPSSWNAAALKKAAKVSSMYSAQQSAQLPDYDMLTYPRPEPYVKELASSAEASDKPDFYNGHAYIADPFHPYKPSDPTEINQMAANMDSETSASVSSERMRYPMFVDEVGEPFAPRSPPFAFPGRYGRYRHPYLQAGAGTAQYTEATFKPLGGEAAASDTPPLSAARGGGKSVPPLSIMLEIFPMGEAKNKDGAATVMWNNFPVAALRPVIRRPPTVPAQGFGAGLSAGLSAAVGSVATGLGAALQQAEAPLRRPGPQLGHPIESAASSHATATTAARFPVLMQGQLSAGQGQPAFGITLSGIQGLQNLAGMPMLDSKHRMVVHLNFYPKKSVKMPMGLRDLAAGDHIGAGASFIPGGTFSQRRQSALGAAEEVDQAGAAGSIAVDVAPLLRSLPPDMQRHLAAILQTYQRASAVPATDTGAGAPREDQDDVSSTEDSYEDYADDNAAASGERAVPGKRQQQGRQGLQGTPSVDAPPSHSATGSSEEDEESRHVAAAASSPVAHWLLGREGPWPSPGERGKKTSAAASFAPPLRSAAPRDRSQRGSYFDVQDEDDDLPGNSRPGEIDQSLEAVADDDDNDGARSPPKPTDRVLQDLETTLTPHERLLLWRHWREMQALERREQEQDLLQRREDLGRKKKLDRTQRMNLTRDLPTEGTSGERPVPENHRIE
ncbi:Puromycin-sensitive aminopeptidase [Frankliniella fusca]|uniref:Puromycin-sensitive aminopeptidase n=1 Tax=Frankliniella fusca TaxID=407009 RepID=A0AAE1LP94_9NEOP|nr:Puromycin-sensitive aminopeptidase [Frankliniella fusca]